MNEPSLSAFLYMREVRFQLLANAREICVNRVGFDVMTHPDGVEAECVCVRLYGQVVEAHKGQVGVQGRTVIVPGTSVNSLSEHNSSFLNEPLPCPWLPYQLPGMDV